MDEEGNFFLVWSGGVGDGEITDSATLSSYHKMQIPALFCVKTFWKHKIWYPLDFYQFFYARNAVSEPVE